MDDFSLKYFPMSMVLPSITDFPEIKKYFDLAEWQVGFVQSYHQEDGAIFQGVRNRDQLEFHFIVRPHVLVQRFALEEWLDNVLVELRIHPSRKVEYTPTLSALRFWGFEGHAPDLWAKPSPSEQGRNLFVDFHGSTFNRLSLYSLADEEKHSVLRGPVLNDAQLERELRSLGWIGISTEPL